MMLNIEICGEDNTCDKSGAMVARSGGGQG